MAREAVLRDTRILTSRRYTCATSTNIPKGTFLTCSGDQTASASTGTGDNFVGFAHAEINGASDTDFNTETSVTADKGGMYELVASGAITRNAYVQTCSPGNYVSELGVLTSMALVVGIAREAASTGETINVEVLP